MAKIIKKVPIDGDGSETFIKVREMPDKYTTPITEGAENAAMALVTGEPDSGRIYTVKFNTARNINMDTPFKISVMGWGVEIRQIYKPEPDLLYVDIVAIKP